MTTLYLLVRFFGNPIYRHPEIDNHRNNHWKKKNLTPLKEIIRHRPKLYHETNISDVVIKTKITSKSLQRDAENSSGRRKNRTANGYQKVEIDVHLSATETRIIIEASCSPSASSICSESSWKVSQYMICCPHNRTMKPLCRTVTRSSL